MPIGFNKDATGYSGDWKIIASKYKSEKSYTCEYCSVNLKEHKKYLHVHHINGVKSNNNVDIASILIREFFILNSLSCLFDCMIQFNYDT